MPEVSPFVAYLNLLTHAVEFSPLQALRCVFSFAAVVAVWGAPVAAPPGHDWQLFPGGGRDCGEY